jgi:heme exporter protein B
MFQFYHLISHTWHTYKQHLVKSYIFFLLIFVLFPLMFSPLKELFYAFNGSIFWFSILITNFLSVEFLFKEEFQIGFFEYILQQHKNLEVYIICKIIIFWLFNIFPLIFISFLYSIIFFDFPVVELVLFIILLSLHTMSLTFLNAIGSVFLHNTQQNFLLIFLILVPLMIPIILFGVHFVTVGLYFNITIYQILIICGNFCFIIFFVPWLIGYLIKININ